MTRSQIMARIKSTGNKSTEMRFRSVLSQMGIKGWSIQPDWINGKPDLAFVPEKVAIFLDGCFWHGCEEHFKEPKTRRTGWMKKIMANKMRDTRNVAELVAEGWKVFRIWEHDLKDNDTVKDIALRVARAADTPDTCEPFTAPRRAPTPGLEVMACIPCGEMTGHRATDITGHGVYKEAECERCLTITRRIRGIALLNGGQANGR